MKSTTVSALSALLLSGAQAVPMAGHHQAPAHAHAHAHAHMRRLRNKRDVVWETVYDIETVVVVETVYADGSQPTGVPYSTIDPQAVPAHPTNPPPPPSPKEPGQSPPPPPAVYVPTTTTNTSTTHSTPQPPPPPPSTLSTTTTTNAPVAAPPLAPTTTTTTTTTTTPPPAPPPPAPAPATYAPAPAQSPSPASSGGGYSGVGGSLSYSGDATYYDPGLGACGITSSSSDHIVAISHAMFDPKTPNGNPNNNPLCGQKINIKAQDGSMVPATIVDRCVGCAMEDLDMTTALFYLVTPNGDGRVHGVQWGMS